MANSSPVRPALVVYKEVVAGDRRKLSATSNDAASGGGARDLRFPSRTFRPVLRRIFAQDAVGRGGAAIRTADVVYRDAAGTAQTTRLEYWPPTKSRPTEDRIPRIHRSPALGGRPPATDRGMAFVLLILFDDQTVRIEYAYEDGLRGGDWGSEIADAILSCMDATARRNAGRRGNLLPVRGYYEFGSGAQFCHAD